MATIYSHAVVGLGLARLYTGRPMPWTYWILAAALPIVPDLDVFSTAAYGGALGHRGITHSLLFALAIGSLAAGATFRRFRVRWWSLAALFSLIIASHGLLDALNRGGANVPFFWPLAGSYGNWGLIPVSDIGVGLPDAWRSRAVRAELLWLWLPTAAAVVAVTAWRRFGPRRSPMDSAAEQ